MAEERNPKSGESLDLRLLALSSIAAVVAAVVTSALGWEKGTLISAAVTPVIVALTKEGLRRPADRLSGMGRRGDAGPNLAAEGPTYRKVYGRRRFRGKLALLTGLAAFVIAVGVLTIPELVAGGAVTGDRETTLFGGSTPTESTPTESTPTESTPTESTPTDSTPTGPAPTTPPTGTPSPGTPPGTPSTGTPSPGTPSTETPSPGTPPPPP